MKAVMAAVAGVKCGIFTSRRRWRISSWRRRRETENNHQWAKEKLENRRAARDGVRRIWYASSVRAEQRVAT
jgi:hypothetical protein